MTNQRRRREPMTELSTAERRTLAQRYQKRRDALMEETLLGLDDGTPEACMAEELDFSKYLDDLDEDEKKREANKRLLEQDAPILEEQKKFREKLAGLKIWR